MTKKIYIKRNKFLTYVRYNVNFFKISSKEIHLFVRKNIYNSIVWIYLNNRFKVCTVKIWIHSTKITLKIQLLTLLEALLEHLLTGLSSCKQNKGNNTTMVSNGYQNQTLFSVSGLKENRNPLSIGFSVILFCGLEFILNQIGSREHSKPALFKL